MGESNIGSVQNDNESPAGLVAESSDFIAGCALVRSTLKRQITVPS